MIISIAGLLLSACEQRDLYVMVHPNIYVEGDWNPSLGRTDMTMDATAVAFDAGGRFSKEYFFRPDNVNITVDRGVYDIMIFNGLMYAADDTHLDGIYFRGTDGIESFEAVAMEAEGNRRLNRTEGEYIATNNMEILTSAAVRRQIESGKEYFVKYRNGKNGFEIPASHTEAEIGMIPEAITHPCQVTVTIGNIGSAYAANAALYGFAGSAYMASRHPSEFMVTHQFNLNSRKIISEEGDIGTIESKQFATFGPPLDMTGRSVTVFLSIVLVNGDLFEEEFDVTDQVMPFVLDVKENLAGTTPVKYRLNIPIAIEIELPDIEPVEGIFEVGEWDDDEIIKVPIKP